MNQPLTPQELTDAVSASVQQPGDIQSKVRELTLHALRTRRLEPEQIRAVVRAVGEGVSVGAELRVGEIRQAVAAALSGLDEALAKAAQATHLALQELFSEGRDFTEHDVKKALDDLKITEQAFMDTLVQVADAGGSRGKQELRDATEHLRRTGSDTAASVKAALSELGSRVSASVQTGKLSSKEAALAVSARLAETASGIFAGMADAFRDKGSQGDDDSRQ